MTNGFTPFITVVIVNYNCGDFIQNAVDSLAVQTFRDFELIVHDNCSTDGSAESLDLSAIPSSRLINGNENTGFSGGVNSAAEQAKGEYLVLMNPDCEASDTWLMELAASARAEPDVAMFARSQIRLDDRTKLDGAGDNYLFFGIPWRGGYGRPVGELPPDGACFAPCGASSMLKRHSFEAVGGFDEDFFCYCEDVDLAFRLRLLGENCAFKPSAVVYHYGGGSTGKDSPFTIYYGTRNRIWTYVKNMPLTALVMTFPLHVVATLYFYLRCPGKERKIAMKNGIIDACLGFSAVWTKRRAIQKRRQTSQISILQAMTWDPLKLARRATDVRPAKSARPC